MDAKKPLKFIRDSKGELREFRYLTTAEMMKVEELIGGCLETNAKFLKYKEVVWLIGLATGLAEAEVIEAFSVPMDLATAARTILTAHYPAKPGSRDDD